MHVIVTYQLSQNYGDRTQTAISFIHLWCVTWHFVKQYPKDWNRVIFNLLNKAKISDNRRYMEWRQLSFFSSLLHLFMLKSIVNTCDFSTLYTTVSNNHLKSRLFDIIDSWGGFFLYKNGSCKFTLLRMSLLICKTILLRAIRSAHTSPLKTI